MTRVLASLALWILLALAAPLAAQDAPQPDYDSWQTLEDTAQEALEAETNIGRLEELRAQLAGWRAMFLSAQDQNAARIETVQGQISSLGPPPAEDEPPEEEQVADRRAALNAQLEELRAPVDRAEQAYTAADGLIATIDRQIRDRYVADLFARQPSPLNPTHWPRAVQAAVDTGMTFWEELVANWNNEARREHAIDTLPLAVPILLVGLLLLLRSPWWVQLLQLWAVGHTRRGRGVLGFILSLGQVTFPLAGAFLIAAAVEITGFAGPMLTEGTGALIYLVAPLVVGFWLTKALFPDDRPGPLAFEEHLSEKLRRYGRFLAVATTVVIAIRVGAELTDRSGVGVSVLLYVPRLVLAFLLYRVGRMLTQARRQSELGEDEGRTLSGSFTRLFGRLIALTAIAAALLTTAGFANATEFLLIPAVETLALTALVLTLQRLVYDLYALVTDSQEGTIDALAPVLIGFALALAALPVYALIWGARVADLTEIWSRFRAGFSFGQTRISPADFVTFLLVFFIGYALTRFVQATLRNSVLPKTKIDLGGRNAITAGIGYVGIMAALIVAVTSAGIDLSSLAIVAGALSVGIGFGLQNVVSNFVSGIILLVERPISEGDWIEVNGETGYVRDISVRSTRIETFDKTDVIVPNADLVSGTVTNWTRGNNVGRVIVPIGVAHGSDTQKVEKVLDRIARDHPMVLLNPPPFIYFKGFSTSSIDFEIRAFLRDVNFVLNVHTDMNHAIARRFREEGIEIPFAQTDLWLRNPESRAGRRSPPPLTRSSGRPQGLDTGGPQEAADGDGR